MQVHRIIKWFEAFGSVEDRRHEKTGRRRSFEDLINVEQVKTAANETLQMSVWRVFGDITNFTGVISVYRMLKSTLQFTPYKVSIIQHLKEADITNCPSFARG